MFMALACRTIVHPRHHGTSTNLGRDITGSSAPNPRRWALPVFVAVGMGFHGGLSDHRFHAPRRHIYATSAWRMGRYPTEGEGCDWVLKRPIGTAPKREREGAQPRG